VVNQQTCFFSSILRAFAEMDPDFVPHSSSPMNQLYSLHYELFRWQQPFFSQMKQKGKQKCIDAVSTNAPHRLPLFMGNLFPKNLLRSEGPQVDSRVEKKSGTTS
jgi:hypothetical protein